MSILNTALADIRHMPYAQIINSNYVFFQSVVSEKSRINVKIYITANTEMICTGKLCLRGISDPDLFTKTKLCLGTKRYIKKCFKHLTNLERGMFL